MHQCWQPGICHVPSELQYWHNMFLFCLMPSNQSFFFAYGLAPLLDPCLLVKLAHPPTCRWIDYLIQWYDEMTCILKYIGIIILFLFWFFPSRLDVWTIRQFGFLTRFQPRLELNRNPSGYIVSTVSRGFVPRTRVRGKGKAEPGEKSEKSGQLKKMGWQENQVWKYCWKDQKHCYVQVCYVKKWTPPRLWKYVSPKTSKRAGEKMKTCVQLKGMKWLKVWRWL